MSPEHIRRGHSVAAVGGCASDRHHGWAAPPEATGQVCQRDTWVSGP